MTAVLEAQHAVSRWLRLRIQHETRLAERYCGLMASGDVAQLFYQLAADVDHSALLQRLLSGKEPLPEPPPLSHAYPVYPDD